MSEAGRTHQLTDIGWVCHVHNAVFEPQEAERNGRECPWCGEAVDV